MKDESKKLKTNFKVKDKGLKLNGFCIGNQNLKVPLLWRGI
jgi:hypothetical protein